MSHRTRGVVATLVAVAVLFVGAAPALANQDEGLDATRKATPALLDALILRPVGLAMTLGGMVLFVPAALFSLWDYPDTTREDVDAMVEYIRELGHACCAPCNAEKLVS